MPSKISRFVQFDGLVCFFVGNISTSKGSKISHSRSVKLLEYGIVTQLEVGYDLTSSPSKMSNGFYAPLKPTYLPFGYSVSALSLFLRNEAWSSSLSFTIRNEDLRLGVWCLMVGTAA